MALCGYSGCSVSRVLTLILTSVVTLSTSPLRLHPEIFGGGGPVLVTTANTAMGDLHIHRKPLRWRSWSYPYHLLLLFRSPTRLIGGPTRCEVLPNTQISPVSLGGNPRECWRYRSYCLPVRGSDTVLTAILLTRVYALWERSRIILWGLLIYAFGFAGFAGVCYPLHSTIPFSAHCFLVGDYPRETPTPSLGTTYFAGMYQRFIEG